MLLIVDNYDSFTFNLYQQVLCSPNLTDRDLRVVRNDRISCDEIRALKPAGIIISPGPGRPETSGITCEVIEKFYSSTPILGVCLGHQAIGHVFGARVLRAPLPVHGKTSVISHDSSGLFSGIPPSFTATRYHSLIVDSQGIPDELAVNAVCDNGIVMGLRHRKWPVHGVQFHPESFLTEHGSGIIANFLGLCSGEGEHAR